MAENFSQLFISLTRAGAVAGLLLAGVLTDGHAVNAQNARPSLVAPINGTIGATPPIVPEGQDGELDHTFGANDGDDIDGFTELQRGFNWLLNLLGSITAQQSDGKILIVASGYDENINNIGSASFNTGEYGDLSSLVNVASPVRYQSMIQRRNYDGSLDPTFGQDGSILIEELAGPGALVVGMTLQSDGKILLAGFIEPDGQNLTALGSGNIAATTSTPEESYFVMRLLNNGSLDTDFATNGIFDSGVEGFDNGFATTVTVQFDGKIVVAGISQNLVEPTSDLSAQITSTYDFFVSRLLNDGSLDSTFAEAGTYVAHTELSEDWISEVFQQSDGNLVVLGTRSDILDAPSAFLTRITALGTVDTTYGIDGVSEFFTNSASLELVKAAMQADGQIVVANNFSNNESINVEIFRITTDGEVDQSFGTDGALIIGDEFTNTYVFDLAIQPDGKIVAVGHHNANLGQEAGGELSTYRFRADSTLDPTFGEGGLVSIDIAPNLVATAIIVQPNGQLVIYGSALIINSNISNENYDFLVRLNSTKPVSVTGLTPSRLLDTRAGSPQGTIVVEKTKFGESKVLRVKVAGASGLPKYGIGAATLNVTVSDPEGAGYITVYPCGLQPLSSNLNFVKNQTVSTSVTTAVSPAGEICLYSSAQTNLIVDVNGWSAPNAGYASINPQRLLDTRALSPQGEISIAKKKYGPDSELRVKVAGAAGLPGARIGSVSLNVTVTEPEDEGFITVYPCGTRPLSSSLNFVAGQTVSTSVTSPVSADGEVCLYSSSPTNLVADAFGWFVEGSGVTPVGPTRLVDSRPASPQGAISVTKKKYGATDELRLPLQGVAGLPDYGIGTVQLTVTATNPSDTGFITVYPCGTLPLASNLNYITGQTIAASVTAQVSADGEVCIYSNRSTNIIVDINGWGNQPQYRCGGILEIPEDENINAALC